MDGLEATREIRRLERERCAPPVAIVACTASTLEDERQTCFEAGMDHFLAKPIDRERLAAVLESLRDSVPLDQPVVAAAGPNNSSSAV
jgi:CheY-like chemotaxis protein